MIIDATNLILGRMASYAAQRAMLGEQVFIINCGEAIVSGNKDAILRDWIHKVQMGSSVRGPFFFRTYQKFVKRAIRGMIKYNSYHGDKALQRILCYNGVPEQLKGKEVTKLNELSISRLSTHKFMKVREICKAIGGK
ncbi:50S ribosomal protein L13 [Candidatus Woesearchaeota archaeon]|nr:50S ribosomal protein L13 [Candidatus Woesearchaeota archaeon]